MQPSMVVSGVRSHPPVDPGSAPRLILSLSGEPERTRCFPSHMMHLNCRTAVMRCLYCPLCRSQTICFWHNSLRLSRRAKAFTCFIVRASWSGFIPARNIGRLDHRKSLVSMSTQLLFSRATRSFIIVQGGATHTYRAEYGACVLMALHAGRHAFCE